MNRGLYIKCSLVGGEDSVVQLRLGRDVLLMVAGLIICGTYWTISSQVQKQVATTSYFLGGAESWDWGPPPLSYPISSSSSYDPHPMHLKKRVIWLDVFSYVPLPQTPMEIFAFNMKVGENP